MEQISRVVDEIKQIHRQYKLEVGEGGRKAWPKSIRDRIDRLEDLGLKPKKISELTEVPYETVCYWRYNRKSQLKPNQKKAEHFHAIAVLPEKNLTVTVAAPMSSEPTAQAVRSLKTKTPATVTVADQRHDIRVEGLPFESLSELLKILRRGSF